MGLEITDVQKLQEESGTDINGQRLRAIVAERRVQELEAEVEALRAQLAATESEK